MQTSPSHTYQDRGHAEEPSPEVRAKVRDMLLRSEAFRKMPREQQMEIANNTVRVADYLARPEGIPGNKIAAMAAAAPARRDPYAFAQDDSGAGLTSDKSQVDAIGKDAKGFTANTAREGAKVAGVFLTAVDFPKFVSGLIEGVFHSIVESSMQQMEAYGQLVANISKTLNEFRDENVSENQGIDHLTDQFPDFFKMDIDTGDDGKQKPVARLRDDADETEAMKKVNSVLPIEGGPVDSLDDDTVRDKLVPAARTQLATSRQQLLATMVLMGINRIVITDGRISAKIMYDFQAKDSMRLQRSAVAYDYAGTSSNPVMSSTNEGTYEGQTQGGSESSSSGKDSSSFDRTDASYYSKGTYKLTQTPTIKAMSSASESVTGDLAVKAQLAGNVDINFKSDYFPLEKMADSFQIGMIQNAAKPGQSGATPAPSGKTAAAATGAPASSTPAAPAAH
jgi:hypothetical protein